LSRLANPTKAASDLVGTHGCNRLILAAAAIQAEVIGTGIVVIAVCDVALAVVLGNTHVILSTWVTIITGSANGLNVCVTRSNNLALPFHTRWRLKWRTRHPASANDWTPAFKHVLEAIQGSLGLADWNTQCATKVALIGRFDGRAIGVSDAGIERRQHSIHLGRQSVLAGKAVLTTLGALKLAKTAAG
jgi:hypothetical protein